VLPATVCSTSAGASRPRVLPAPAVRALAVKARWVILLGWGIRAESPPGPFALPRTPIPSTPTSRTPPRRLHGQPARTSGRGHTNRAAVSGRPDRQPHDGVHPAAGPHRPRRPV